MNDRKIRPSQNPGESLAWEAIGCTVDIDGNSLDDVVLAGSRERALGPSDKEFSPDLTTRKPC